MLFPFKIYVSMYMCTPCIVYTMYIYLVPVEVKKEPWILELESRTTMWVLGTNPGCS